MPSNYHFGRSALENVEVASSSQLHLHTELDTDSRTAGPAETEGGGDGREERGGEEGREWGGERHQDYPV